MHLQKDIWIVGSGQNGIEISNTLDCNVYLVADADEYVLIDAGAGIEPERIVRNIESLGIAMSSVTRLLLTHVHGDHAAGAAYYSQMFGISIVASEAAAPWLETADLETTSLGQAIASGVYPADFQFVPCPVDQKVKEGDTIRLGRKQLIVLETPGHARGHISYLLEEDGVRSLFSGDALFAGGKIFIQNTWDCSIPEYAATMEKLYRLEIDRLYPGHGAFLLSSAHKHVEKALRYFQRLDIPPNL